jgi:hypothetical protein
VRIVKRGGQASAAGSGDLGERLRGGRIDDRKRRLE